MDRRSFLRGTLISATAGGAALVQLAAPGDVKALVAQREVLMGQPDPSIIDQNMIYMYGSPVYLKDGSGNFYQVGFVTKIEITHRMIDVSTAWEGTSTFVPGLKEGKLTFEGQR